MTQYLKFPNFDPIVFSIGPISLHWYGVMYLFGIFGALLLANYRIKQPNSGWTKKQVENLLFWGFIALFIGGRLGYTLFYNFAVFRQDPTVVFRVWEGGMSFHGGLIGGLIAVAIFAKLNNKKFMQVSDFIAPLIPIGLMFGRLGNFINGELWGRVTDSPIGMIFPTSRQADILYLKAHPQLEQLFVENGYFLPRHPSQLYELFFEGLVLFMILNYFILNKRPAGSVTGLAILCYGVFRFMIEFFRQPDEQLGLYLNFISMGQILCLPMIFGGIILFRYAYRSNQKRDEK